MTTNDQPFFLSFGEAYMDGNADAFGEIAAYLTGTAIGTKHDAVRTAMLSAAEYVRSRQRDCDTARWELRDDHSSSVPLADGSEQTGRSGTATNTQ